MNDTLDGADGDTALHRGVADGYTEVVRDLISAKASVEHRNRAGDTPLDHAIAPGRECTVGLLADVRDEEGNTAACRAAKNGYVELLEGIIQARRAAKHDANDEGHSPLMLAAFYGNRKVVHARRYGGKHGVDVAGQTKIVRRLVDANASLDMRNENDENALDLTRNGGHDDVVDVLAGEENATMSLPVSTKTAATYH